ncbi:bacteriohemerythrin [Roseospira marina]|uniref:Bacteriohemerythrin n=1 Tax=Roseospira marina TaxID=140057 RepID=A0A5M6IAD3_9PROT|nr:bacteriohemerythrin [Roseospira marina]KAA5605112.1 bacteriohemerythrin [Roseospira marina]MBB4314862.1 hemerythrin-like metal-binding protein [Roseospira marina]MBB5087862.1 hemerythrin-like metal-binding protein [Roseospira marina]
MAYLNWTTDLETGIAFVDRDHKMLVALLNQAYDCIGAPEEPATLGSVLSALVEYTEFHFAREERLMEAARYPHLAGHKDMHRGLTDRVHALRGRYLEDPRAVHAQEVMDFLRGWLIDHILKQDFRFRAAVIAAPEAARMAVSPEAETEDDVPERRAGATLTPTTVTPGGDGGAPDPALASGFGGGSMALDFGTLSVLVVDDNPNFQVILRTILKGLGCPSVMLVDSGFRGLDVLEAGAPGLILVDWRMDGMDGLAFVRRARDMGVAAPIVMISGYGEPGFAVVAREAGVDAFLEKPITARGLIKAVADAIRERRPGSAAGALTGPDGGAP